VRGNPHATFDEAGAGNVVWLRCCDTRRRKGEVTGNTNFDLPPTRQSSTLPGRAWRCDSPGLLDYLHAYETPQEVPSIGTSIATTAGARTTRLTSARPMRCTSNPTQSDWRLDENPGGPCTAVC